MARIDEVRERYESITEQLYKNKETFAEYLKFAGKFYKMPTAQTMTMFATNPKATMVADYDTWKKYGHYVKRGANSIAVLCGNGLKHYFDISQTNGERVPYQWTLDKQTAQEFIAAFSKAEGREFKSMSSCVNAIGRAAAAETIENAVKALNISEADRAAFEKSFISITQYFIAARCELGGKFDYKNAPMDLTAFDLVHSKAEAEKLTEYVQISARPASPAVFVSEFISLAARSLYEDTAIRNAHANSDKESFALEVETVANSYYTRLITERESSEYSVEQLAPLYNRFQQDKAFKAEVISSLTEQLDETLSSLEVTRSKAAELGIPFSDRPYNSEEEDNPYAYDGSMSIEDSRKVADANNLRDFMLDYSDELELAAVSYNSDEFRKYFADRAAEALRSSYDTQWDEMKDNPEYMRSVCDLVSASLYTDILSEIQQRNIKYPVVYVNGSHNRNFSPEEVGFKLNYPYSVEEFNAALKEANERWNNDDKYVDKLHSVSVSVFASRTESSTYNVELYASYHSIGEIIDMKQSIASANILGKLKEAISEIENKTQDEIPADLDKFYVNPEMETAQSPLTTLTE